jgi:ABC-type uncharacterized transport system fused permease/ATPase subunit
VGRFYRLLIDGDVSALLTAFTWSAALYAGSAATAAAARFLRDVLSLRWRCQLTAALQTAYCETLVRAHDPPGMLRMGAS